MMELNELNKNAMGGSELMAKRIYETIDPKLLEEFQIIFSRVRELKKDKIRLYFCHDLPQDPESAHLKNKGWEKFHKLIFVSYWQQQSYINYFGIPYSYTTVIKNAIEPIERQADDVSDKIKFIYHTTPHRGLDILVSAFENLTKKHSNIHLDVYSSFNAYGWPDPDKFQPLFDKIKNHKNMTYHGFKPNDQIRIALSKSHVYAYPCTWPETSCLSLIEAMSAGLVCIHPSLAVLPETSMGSTIMYDYDEDKKQHLQTFENMLDVFLTNTELSQISIMSRFSQSCSNLLYNWENRKQQWEFLLGHLLDTVTDREAMKKKEYLYVNTSK